MSIPKNEDNPRHEAKKILGPRPKPEPNEPEAAKAKTAAAQLVEVPREAEVLEFPKPAQEYLDPNVNLETLVLPLTKFPSVKRTIPEREWTCIGWQDLIAEVAPDLTSIAPNQMIWFKDNVPYYIAGTLKEAEFVHKTREQALKEGRSTFGKQRSAAHIASLGPAFFLDDDGDVFTRETRLRAFGAAAIIYSSHSYGFVKEGKTVPSQGGRVVLFLNRPVTPNEYVLIWDAINHVLGGGFDESGRSTALCYGRHVRRSVDARPKRVIIEGAALNTDALVELGRSLRPQHASQDQGLGHKPNDEPAARGHKHQLAVEIERTKLMGKVRPPDEYMEWMSGVGAFKRAFPNDDEAAFTCFDIWSSCFDKYPGSDVARKKFDEVPAEYEGPAIPVELGMLHWRARRRAENVIRTLYAQPLPLEKVAAVYRKMGWDNSFGAGLEDYDEATYPKGGEPVSRDELKPTDGPNAVEYILFCWSEKVLEEIQPVAIPPRVLEEARQRTEERRERIDLGGRVLHKWKGKHLARDTDELADAIIRSGAKLYKYDRVLVRISAPISNPATAARIRKIYKYQGEPGGKGDPAHSASLRLSAILPSETEALRAIISDYIATKIPKNTGTKNKPVWEQEIGSFGFRGKNIRQEPDNDVLKDLAKRALVDRAPEIVGVVTAPVMANLPASTKPEDLLRAEADSIITKEGFDPATGLYLAPLGAIVEVPAEPSQEQVKAATDLLQTPWIDFPFASPGQDLDRKVSHSSAIYAMMIAANRRVLTIAPGVGITAPGEGMSSGKTLGGEVIGCVATGEIPTPVSLSTDFNEQRKEIITYLVEGDGVLFLDNHPIGIRFDAAPLAASMTSSRFKGRLLGANKTISANTQIMVIADGCSLNMAGDLASRFILIRLDTGLERPEDRSIDEYEIPDLRGWIVEHRQEIVAAVHTVVRAYLQICRQRGGTPSEVAKRRKVKGTRFEGPCEVLRDAFVWAFPEGLDPFLGFKASTLASSTRAEKGQVLWALNEAMRADDEKAMREGKEKWFTANELIYLLGEDWTVAEAAMHSKGGFSHTPNPVSFGRWLIQQLVDSPIDGLVLRSRVSHNTATFRVDPS